MSIEGLFWTSIRAASVYVLLLTVIRLLGKRTVGNFSAFDLLVALMLGEVVDEMTYGEVPFIQGAVAIATIAVAKYVTAWLSFKSSTFGSLVEGVPRKIVEHGEFQRDAMKKELVSEQEVRAGMRLQGVENLKEVKVATMETDGEISVIREDWAEPVQKRDLEHETKIT